MSADSSELDGAPSGAPHALLIGSSDGIGLALTRSLLRDGWRVIGLSRSPSPVEAAGYTHHVLDVCAPSYPARLSALVDATPALALCVYCAGIGQFLRLDTGAEALAAERRVFETNLLGAVATLEVVLPTLLRARRGHFIGLSSQADELIDPNAPSYAASKAGLSSYLEGLALACRSRGVHVTNLRFGFVDTKMAKSAVRPFMISPEAAAARIRHCMRARPIRDTFPKRMAALLWLVRAVSAVRRCFL